MLWLVFLAGLFLGIIAGIFVVAVLQMNRRHPYPDHSRWNFHPGDVDALAVIKSDSCL